MQIRPNIVVQTQLALQDGISHQGSRQGLAQRTDFVEGRIGRRGWLPGFHVAAMTDEFLAPIYDSDRGRVEQRLLDQRCGDLIDLRPQIFRRDILARAARGQERGGQYYHRLFRTIIEVACMRRRLKGNVERALKIADCRGPRLHLFSRLRLFEGWGSGHSR